MMTITYAIKQRVLRTTMTIRDVHNRTFYGRGAPKYAELIWVKPSEMKCALIGPSRYRTCSGKVIDLWKHFSVTNLRDTPRIKSCFDRWVRGLPWEHTSDYQIMLKAIQSGKDWANCKTETDLQRRYTALDQAFEEVRREGRLKTRQELNPRAYREEGGILVSVGPRGEPLLYDGFHRMGMALVLDLDIVPAQVGYVDRKALGLLDAFRSPSIDVSLPHMG